MQQNTQENCLIQVIKELKDCLFWLMIIQQVIIKFLLILLKKYFLSRVKVKNYNIEIDGRNFMISQLMNELSNTKKSEKYQQDKVMIIQHVVYWILFFFKKYYRLIAADFRKQKAFDADRRATQQIFFYW